MTIEQLYNMCVSVSTGMSYTTKNGQHDLTDAVLKLQVCLDEMGKKDRVKLSEILAKI